MAFSNTKKTPVQLSEFVRPVVRGDDMHPLLFDLLSNATPHPHEEPVANLIKEHVLSCGRTFEEDAIGNLIVRVGKRRKHKTLFSSHMDTVHSNPGKVQLLITDGATGEYQDDMVYGVMEQPTYGWEYKGKVLSEKDIADIADEHDCDWYSVSYYANAEGLHELKSYPTKTSGVATGTGVFFKKVKTGSKVAPSVLGADDKLGCYIMCRMISAGVEGMYIFHVGEETGCVGSTHIATHTPKLLKDIDRAVAFDRKGYGDVINRQMGGTCASGKFCTALAEALSVHMPPNEKFVGNVQGVYTDTAEYTDLVPECTNLSVGYFDQHTDGEHFDLLWLSMMVDACIKLDWQGLPTISDPKAKPVGLYGGYAGYGGYKDRGKGSYGYTQRYPYHGFNGGYGDDLDEEWEQYMEAAEAARAEAAAEKKTEEKKEPTLDDDPQLSEDYWHRLGFVAPWEVGLTTPNAKVPEWNPKDGAYYLCTREQMTRIIRKHLASQPVTMTTAVEIIADMADELALLRHGMAN